MKNVLITGGSSGLGKVTAAKLVEAGYKVTILARGEAETKSVAKELGCEYVLADVSDYQQVEKAVQKVKAKGQIDILVNNAGIWIQGPLEENDPEKIKKAIEVNTLGPINCTRAVIADMKARKSGKIVNISSQGGLYGKAERGVYNASKFALTGFIRAMQAELKPYNASMIGIFPSAMKNTEIFAKAGNDRDMSKALDPSVVADAIVNFCNLPDGVNVTEFGIESLSY